MGDADAESVKFDLGDGGEPGGGGGLPGDSFGGGGMGPRSFFSDGGGGPDFFTGSLLSPSGLLFASAFLSEEGTVLSGVSPELGGGKGPRSFFSDAGGPDF